MFLVGSIIRNQYITSIGLFYKNVGILLGVSDTVKNERELIAGDDGVCLGESNIYHQLVDFSIMGDLNRKVVIK